VTCCRSNYFAPPHGPQFTTRQAPLRGGNRLRRGPWRAAGDGPVIQNGAKMLTTTSLSAPACSRTSTHARSLNICSPWLCWNVAWQGRKNRTCRCLICNNFESQIMSRVKIQDARNVTCLTCHRLCFKRTVNPCSSQHARCLCCKSSATAGIRQELLHPEPRIPAPLCCVGSRPLQALLR
jgi:hypothetical protein